MGLRVVGAGLGRTGTHSLKVALEQLLGGPCYHMVEVLGHPEHLPIWTDAINGVTPDWEALFSGYVSAVDWPVAAFWRPLSELWPDAIILLSSREDAAGWWKSAHATIFEATALPPPPDEGAAAFSTMTNAMLDTCFTPAWQDEAAACAAYEAHNADVRATAPADRLVEWHPGDGWAPLCAALGVPEPAEPFPHVNSTEEFRGMMGLDAS